MFSVVIPLYNKATTIADTLNSVLKQTFDDYEVVVVDDGSTDESLKIAQSFFNPRIRIYSKLHEGVSETRNYGIDQAREKYIAFLDADDLWEPDYLKEMFWLIKKYPDCSMFASAYKVISKNKTSVKCTTLPEGVLDNIFAVRFQHRIMRISATVVQKNVFDIVGGFPEGMIGGEDEYTWAKIAIRFKVAFTPKVLATYDNRYSSFQNRKGKMDHCKESWFDLYEEGNFYLNEFIAYKAITAGIRYAFGTSQVASFEIEEKTKFTMLSKQQWNYLYFLNHLPFFVVAIIKRAIPLYKDSKSFCSRTLKGIKGKLHKTSDKKKTVPTDRLLTNLYQQKVGK